MAWIIASVPFWLLGCGFLGGAHYCLRVRHPGETAAGQGIQALIGLLAAGICFAVAAKVAS